MPRPTKKRPLIITHPELENTDNGLWAKHAAQYADGCPICAPKLKAAKLKQRAVPALHKALVEFGYSTLTTEAVEAAYDRALAGEQPTDIIDRMVASQMREAGLLK